MANTPAVKARLSHKELEEAYVRLKSKGKRANEVAKREGEGMMRNLVTVGSALGMGWYMGDSEKNRGDKTIEESQQFSGIDADLIIGGGALAAGMMKWGGKFSETLSAIGTGVLSGYGYRRGHSMGVEPDKK